MYSDQRNIGGEILDVRHQSRARQITFTGKEGKKFPNGDTLQPLAVSCIKVLMAGQLEWGGGGSLATGQEELRPKPTSCAFRPILRPIFKF